MHAAALVLAYLPWARAAGLTCAAGLAIAVVAWLRPTESLWIAGALTPVAPDTSDA